MVDRDQLAGVGQARVAQARADGADIDAALVDRALKQRSGSATNHALKQRSGSTDTPQANQAFETLVRRHQASVRAQLHRLLGGDAASADDLAQETFVLAWRKLAQFRGEARFTTWLYRIAHSCFLQYLRSKGMALNLTLDDEHDHTERARAEPSEGSAHLGLDLAAAMHRLSPPQRLVLLYCAQLELSHEEAAQLLDMPLGTVKTHAARGKAKLRELLYDYQYQRVKTHE